jgi:hypothetical protein
MLSALYASVVKVFLQFILSNLSPPFLIQPQHNKKTLDARPL